MIHKNIMITEEQASQVKELLSEHRETIQELRRKESMTGRAGEAHIFRIALDIGLPEVATVLANTSKN